MRISYNWLRQLLPALESSARDRSPAAVAERLTDVGLELEEVVEFGAGLDSVVLAEVVKVEQHPARDRLSLVTVSLGDNQALGKPEQTVVCGASNVPAPGGLVALAPLGSYLPAVNLKLEPRKLGGIISEGMLCSETELGLGAESDGILTFEAGRFAAGTPFLKAFPEAQDTTFEIGVTPNRPDALGHIGVARDIAAVYEIDFQVPDPGTPKKVDDQALSDLIEIDNRAKDRCPRYGAAAVMNVTVQKSPEWLRWRLFSLGVRPISNVVDITNLLLLEYGNPMHAFDLSKVEERKIVIRHASDGETMKTLDDVERQLEPSDLVISDGKRPSAIAGIMGGADSEISTETKDVLLECAYFDPRGIRRTARRLTLQTDSSYRFERGVGFAHLEDVLRRACTLLSELADGAVVPGQLFDDGSPPELPEVRLRAERMERLLGVAIDASRATEVLHRLGFESVAGKSNPTFRAPSFRPDVSLEADLIEEVARIVGLDAIPTELPAIQPQAPSGAAKLERRTRRAAAELGLSEAVTYSFVADSDLKKLRAPAPTVTLKNPLTEERNVLTSSLLPGLVEVVRRARRRGEHDIRVFSVASRFLRPLTKLPEGDARAARPRAEEDRGALPEERLSFAAALAGARPSYLGQAELVDVFDAKGVALEMLARLTKRSVQVTSAPELQHLHPRGAARLSIDGVSVGTFGPLHPDVIDALDLGDRVYVIELDLVAVERVGQRLVKYRPIPKLPAVTRDIALEAPEEMAAGDLMQAIRKHAGELCESVELFDVFTGKGLESGHRSLGFRVVYRDPKATTDPDQAKTLTDKQVDKQHQRVVKAVEKLGVNLRA